MKASRGSALILPVSQAADPANRLLHLRGLASRTKSDPRSLSFILIWYQLPTRRSLVRLAFVTGRNLTGNPQAGGLWPLSHYEYKGLHKR